MKFIFIASLINRIFIFGRQEALCFKEGKRGLGFEAKWVDTKRICEIEMIIKGSC